MALRPGPSRALSDDSTTVLDIRKLSPRSAPARRQARLAIDQPGAVAPPHDVAGALAAEVEIHRVGGLEAVHESAGVPPRGLHHPVEVIRHQAVRMESNVVGLDTFSQAA